MAEETKPSSSAVTATSSNVEMDPQVETGTKAPDATTEEHTSGQAAEGATGKVTAEGATTTTNGEAADAANGTTADTAAMAAETEDTAMKGTEETPTSSSAVPATNGTPASSKKASNGSHKKKSAVPEHKSKKLNKKKSKPLTNLDAEPGQYYFARMKGHAPWPSIVCDEEMLPQSLIETRPVTTKQPDGTFKKPEYADGGKRAYERTFPIMFLHTNEFAWIPNTELTPLDTEAAKEPSEKGKSKLLLAAYEKAAENQPLQHYKDMLADHQKALQEDMEAQAERDAKKASKSKRKSMDATAVVDDGDEMDIDEAPSTDKPKSKKRKKDADSDGEGKSAKTPKTSTKLKLSTPKTPASEPSSKKKAAKSKASSSKKIAAKVTASDDEDMVDTPKVEEKPLSPAAAKDMKEKKVLYYRHKLQRGFLSRDTMPKEEEMKSMSDFLSELETYPDLEGSIIRKTKIHKVLKAMIKLHSIPLDEEYQFKKRSHELLDKWTTILSSDPGAEGAADKDDDAKPEATTNGTNKDSEEQAEKAEAGEAAAPEEAKDEELEKKVGTTVEGEKEAEKEKEPEVEKTAEEEKTDGPAVDSAPAEEYKPPAETAEASA